MSRTTPDDYGHGDGSTFPESPGQVDPSEPLPHVATEQDASEAEAEQALGFERGSP